MRRLYLAPEEFAQVIAQATVRLDGVRARRLRDVLRMTAGSELRVFDGLGNERAARIAGDERAGRDAAVTLALGAPVSPLPEPPVPVTLVCAFPRGQRGDWIVEKTTELGVGLLVPVEADRSVMRPGEGRRARWRRVAIEAAEQCGRAVVPVIASEPPPGALTLLLDPAAGASVRERLAGRASPVAGVVVQVGPEGGWSAAEREARLATGALPVSLGPRTLRVETAAVLAVAQVLEATGGLAVSDVAGG